MKQQMKRYISLLLALLLCVGLFTLPISAEETSGTCGENLTWTLQNGVLTISGKGEMMNFSERNLAPWYEIREQIQLVVIEKNVTSVGDVAFYQCTNLQMVTLPDSVKTLGSLAFNECPVLTRINLPNVEEIGWGCFYGCESLVNVILPSSLRVIGEKAFYCCRSLGGIIIPASVESLGASAFSYCSSMVYARVEANISILPHWIFYGCDMLTQLYLTETINELEDNALGECDSLYHVEFGGSDVVKESIEEQLGQKTPSSGNSSEVDYSQSNGAAITTTTKAESDHTEYGEETYVTTIEATITDDSGWDDLVDAVIEVTTEKGYAPVVDVVLQEEVSVNKDSLEKLTDSKVIMTIHTSDNAEWKLVLEDQSADTLKGKQNLGIQIVRYESDRFKDILLGAESYLVTIGSTRLNSTLMIPLGNQAARKVATLYAVSGRKLNKLSSVIVDYDGKAAFCLAGTSAGDYILALNVPNIDNQEVLVPEKLAPEFDITYGATLTDSQGNQYILTGRVNKLGFGLGTLTWIIVGVLVGSVILVGVIMVIWNKQQQKMYKQRRKSK